MTDQRHDWQFQGVQSDRPQYKCLRCGIGTMSPKQEIRRCEPMADQLRGERLDTSTERLMSKWRKSMPPGLIDSEVDVAAIREAEAVITHLQKKFGGGLSIADCAELLKPEFDFLSMSWDADTVPDIPKEQDITKAFHPSAPTEIDTIISKAVDAIFHRGRAEQLVLLADRTLCSIRQDEPRLKFEPAYSKWLALHDEAMAGLENAVEAFEKAQEGG